MAQSFDVETARAFAELMNKIVAERDAAVVAFMTQRHEYRDAAWEETDCTSEIALAAELKAGQDIATEFETTLETLIFWGTPEGRLSAPTETEIRRVTS